jgi:hypothetical protein
MDAKAIKIDIGLSEESRASIAAGLSACWPTATPCT